MINFPFSHKKFKFHSPSCCHSDLFTTHCSWIFVLCSHITILPLFELIITIYHVCCSWWSYCISSSDSLPVLGWRGRRWLSPHRDNTQSCNSSCCCWSLWLLLFWTCCVPKHLHIHGKSKPIPCSALSMVNLPRMSFSQSCLLVYNLLPLILSKDIRSRQVL